MEFNLYTALFFIFALNSSQLTARKIGEFFDSYDASSPAEYGYRRVLTSPLGDGLLFYVTLTRRITLLEQTLRLEIPL